MIISTVLMEVLVKVLAMLFTASIGKSIANKLFMTY